MLDKILGGGQKTAQAAAPKQVAPQQRVVLQGQDGVPAEYRLVKADASGGNAQPAQAAGGEQKKGGGLLGNLLQTAGTALGGIVGGPLGAAAGNAIGGALGGGAGDGNSKGGGLLGGLGSLLG